MVTDRILAAITEANDRVTDVTFLALLGRPGFPVTICMHADRLIPLTIYQGTSVDDALQALSNALASLERVRPERTRHFAGPRDPGPDA